LPEAENNDHLTSLNNAEDSLHSLRDAPGFAPALSGADVRHRAEGRYRRRVGAAAVLMAFTCVGVPVYRHLATPGPPSPLAPSRDQFPASPKGPAVSGATVPGRSAPPFEGVTSVPGTPRGSTTSGQGTSTETPANDVVFPSSTSQPGTAIPEADPSPPVTGTSLPVTGTSLPVTGTSPPVTGTSPPDTDTAPPPVTGTGQPEKGTSVPVTVPTSPPATGTSVPPTSADTVRAP
jgi:hypothetical protein